MRGDQIPFEGIPPKPPRVYPEDPIFDALTEEFGPVRTASERGRRNSAVRELRAAEATPDEIHIVVAFCRRNFTTFTEGAVCSWFSRALLENEQSGQTRATFLRLLSPKGGEE